MPQAKLLKKKGVKLAAFSLPPAKLKALRPQGLKAPARVKLKTLSLRSLKVPAKELLVIPERITRRDLLQPDIALCRIYCPPRLRIRKDQKDLTDTEWLRFIHALEALADPALPNPHYDDFVNVHHKAMTDHASMTWGAHSMSGHDGRNFLPWHREFLIKLEARMRRINPLVTIPYWNWVEDRQIPTELSDPDDLAEWGITRSSNFNGAMLPDAVWINNVMNTGVAPPNFGAFSSALESPHNTIHNVVGGTMATSRSPADPIFWLHHAFIDKLWADWQVTNAGTAFDPPNAAETLQESPILTRKVSQVLRTQALGYVYA